MDFGVPTNLGDRFDFRYVEIAVSSILSFLHATSFIELLACIYYYSW